MSSLGFFNPQIGHRDVEQLLCQDSGSCPARLEVRKSPRNRSDLW